MWPDRLTFSWVWTECPSMSGSIRMDVKDGSNAFWQAFYLSNSQFPITAAKLNGESSHELGAGMLIPLHIPPSLPCPSPPSSNTLARCPWSYVCPHTQERT